MVAQQQADERRQRIEQRRRGRDPIGERGAGARIDGVDRRAQALLDAAADLIDLERLSSFGRRGAGKQHPRQAAAGESILIVHRRLVDQIRHSLEERLHTPVDTVDPRAAATLTDRITAAPALLDALAPLVGLLLRDHTGVPA